MNMVLDTSVTLAWLYPAEVTPAIDALFERVITHGAVVPALWQIEIANSLTASLRRGKISRKERDAALKNLSNLNIYAENESSRRAWSDTLALADRHNLTVHDGVYLELAMRLKLPLATLDRDLRRAAEQEKVLLLGV